MKKQLFVIATFCFIAMPAQCMRSRMVPLDDTTVEDGSREVRAAVEGPVRFFQPVDELLGSELSGYIDRLGCLFCSGPCFTYPLKKLTVFLLSHGGP